MNFTVKITTFFLLFMFFQDLIAANLPEAAASYFTFIDELFIICGLTFVIARSRSIRKSTLTLLLIMLGILLLGFLSGAYQKVPLDITLKGAFLTVKGMLLFFIFKNLKFSEADINKIMKLILALGILSLFFAVVDILFKESFRNLLNTNNKLDTRSNILSVQSLFVHPGVYGWFTLFVGLYFLAQYLVKGEKKAFIYTFLFFFFSILSLRSKVLMAIGAILILVTIKRRVYIVGLTFLGIIVFLLFGDVIQDLILLTTERYISADVTESARKALYQTGYLIALSEFPLGEGFGRFGSWIARVEYSPVYYEYGLNNVYGLRPDNPIWATDTYWPSIMGEIGIIGMVLLISFFAFMLRSIYVKFRDLDLSKDVKAFLLFTLFVIVQSLVESSGEQIFNSSPQYIYIFAVIGIAFSLIENRNNVRSYNK